MNPFVKFFETISKYLILETESLTSRARYLRFRTTLLLMFITLSIAPMGLISVVTYYQYLDLLESKSRNNLMLNIASTKKRVEVSIDELISVMAFIMLDHPYELLSDQVSLEQLFVRMQSQYKDFVDLGVIDNDGIQRSYAGPYSLGGKDYSEDPSFTVARQDNVYISSVYLGYRKEPHFIIAIKKNTSAQGKSWILRATIDADSLKTYIDNAISAEETDDVFLVSHEGHLQLSSRYFGSIMDEYDLPPIDPGSQISFVQKKDRVSKRMAEALAFVEGTPWILVMAQESPIFTKTFSRFRTQLIVVFVLFSTVVLLVIVRTVNFVGTRVREADQRRDDILGKAEHSNKLASIGRLAAGVAHEINNPLATIGQKAGLMLDIFEMTGDFENKEKLVEQINGIKSSVDRGTVITHRLLGFARRMDISAEKVEINNLVSETIGFLEMEAEHRKIKIGRHLQKELPPIQSDRGKLQQIVLNIINNAIDALEGKERGQIDISTVLTEESKVKIIIDDNGAGMPPKVLNKIFEPFFTTKETGKGTGLGLSITYGLVKELGGEIHVDSKLDEGTTFTVELPLTLDQDEVAENGNG
nr:ATP-binding protein [Desulfobulbaceae bacterium]